MTVATWDRAAFTLKLATTALRVDGRHCQALLKSMGPALLSLPRQRTIVPADGELATKRLVLLSPGLSELPPPARALVDRGEAEVVPHTLTLDYDYWTSDQILGAVLPEDVVVPSSFETVGHIAHINLKDMHEPYKEVIGKVMLEKHPLIETVINKVDTIDTQFRFFRMEILAGRADTVAEVSENNCIFRFDYAKVYWNSRLHTEHRRLVQAFAPGAVICDLFAGVGPFAIPAGKKGCIVHANDLNPASYDALVANIQRNKVSDQVTAYNMDARACVAQAVKPMLAPGRRGVDHVVMNLPASAIEFLDAFQGIGLGLANLGEADLPTVHCYCFSTAMDAPVADVLQRVDAALGAAVDRGATVVTHVRSVAPGKDMYCCSFPLPLAVALARAGTRAVLVSCHRPSAPTAMDDGPRQLKTSRAGDDDAAAAAAAAAAPALKRTRSQQGGGAGDAIHADAS